MRLHPKRRASIDQRPGPNIASAAPAVPNKSHTHRSPGSTNILKISITATEAPAIGVHSPASSRIPAANESTASTVTFIGESLANLIPARTTSADPITRRMRSNPVPGHPPANVEYRRRNHTPLTLQVTISGVRARPQKGPSISLFRVKGTA